METASYNFWGWATKFDTLCSDSRIIRSDAFKHHDGQTVPLVWNHDHSDPYRVLGNARLEHCDEGVKAYCTFNDTDLAQTAKVYVEHGDITHLSIYANQLKQQGNNVMHGIIREVSLVLAGANPGAHIENVIKHGEESEEEAEIKTIFENIELYHADKEDDKKEDKPAVEETKKVTDSAEGDEETIEDVYNTFTEKQKKVVHYLIAKAVEDGGESDDDTDTNDDKVEHSEGGDDSMKSNVFDQTETKQTGVLSHADQQAIISLAKQPNVGSLKLAMEMYSQDNDALAHGFESDALVELLPDYKNITPGAPEILRQDQSWVMTVIRKIHKSPVSRVRTRYADARIAELRAKGYQNKGDEKKLRDNIKLIGRSHDPQTIYVKDEAHRDDVTDITDFDYIAYIWSLMNDNMYETLALAALVGDDRDDADPDKIHEEHIQPVWTDNELYTIHTEVDIEAAKAELQGTDTGANFGENYIYAEAIITAALYSREKFKGSGRPDLYCAPHLVNVMLLARDLNGRRIYDSKADLAKALNVGEIHEIEQLDGKTRTTEDGKTKKLLGLFVNLADYQFGSTKGGEVTKFDDFDIDFNKHKFLMETRLSGALTKLYSAIALEEPVNA